MKKRVLLSVLASVMVLFNITVPAAAKSIVPEEETGEEAELLQGTYYDLIYEITDDTVTITGFMYDGENSRVVIPETIDGYPVTKIADHAFSDNSYIPFRRCCPGHGPLRCA